MDTHTALTSMADSLIQSIEALDQAAKRIQASLQQLGCALQRLAEQSVKAAKSMAPAQTQQRSLSKTIAATSKAFKQQKQALGAYERQVARVRAPQELAGQLGNLQEAIVDVGAAG